MLHHLSKLRFPSLPIPLRARRLWQRRSLRVSFLFFALGVGLSFVLAACSVDRSSSPIATAPASQTTLRIGYQKSATVLNLLKRDGTLEQRLQPQGVAVEWTEFAAGPQMLEALNVGSIDFGYTGETPPVIAQAAGAPLQYVAYEPLGPAAEAILVQSNSPIQTVADLKGKAVALNKGSNVHYLLVRALEAAGLQYGDIQTVFLPPSDARPAFEQGGVAAWVIWDPFLAAAEKAIGARILTDGKNLVANRGFFLSTQSFTRDHADVVNALIEELRKTSDWAAGHSSEVAEFLSAEMGVDKAALELAETRRGYDVQPLTNEVIAGQQQIADTFYQLKLIPQAIQVADVVWQPS